MIDKPGIIVGRKGSCGALNVCFEPFWATDVSYYIIPPAGIDLKFAFILLKSLNLERLGKGIKPGLNRNEAYQLVTSLPPYNEQHRIVAKVDQLMSLCDELEARQQKKRETRAYLNSAALDRLLGARAQGEFAEGWRRISDNFDLLYDAPENVGALRKAILRLMIMGKLVTQDEKDEPASVLLNKIRVEKERLVKDGKIKKFKPLLIIKPAEIPFKIPNGWEGVRLGDIVYLKSGTTFDKEIELKGGGTPYLKVADMNLQENNKEIITSSRFIEETDEIRRYIIPRNSIIFPKRGGAIATNKKRIVRQNIFVDLNTMALCCPDNVYLEYLFYWFLQVDLWSLNNGTSVPQINNTDIEPLLFFLPPLNEQRRIVARVDQLMSLCNEIEAGLMRSQADSEKLMEAVVGRMLAG